MTNFNSHPYIREAFKQAEMVDARGEICISLHRLKNELEKYRIQQKDLRDYLLLYTSASYEQYNYIIGVLPRLYDKSANIDKSELFQITSGLR